MTSKTRQAVHDDGEILVMEPPGMERPGAQTESAVANSGRMPRGPGDPLGRASDGRPVPEEHRAIAAASVSQPARAPDPTDLMDWVRAHGGRVGSLEVRTVRGLRGLHAAQDLSPGDLVMDLPWALTITPEVAAQTRLGKLVAASEKTISTWAALALFLVETRREGGFWKLYVDLLPQSFPTHPYCFDLADIDAFDAKSNWPELVRHAKKKVAEEHASLADILPPEDQVSLDEFCWAYTCVKSRAFGKKIDGDAQVPCLMPLMDMFNHVDVPPCSGTSRGDGYRMTAAQPMRAGTEIFISYTGRETAWYNGWAFLSFGFCSEDVDSVRGVIVSPADHFLVRASHSDEEMRKLLAHLRAFCASNHGPSPAHWNFEAPINPLNEVQALSMLRFCCEFALNEFATTIDEDEARIARGGLSPCARIALDICLAEKRIARRLLQMAEAAMQWISNAPDDAAARMAIGDEGYLAVLEKAFLRRVCKKKRLSAEVPQDVHRVAHKPPLRWRGGARMIP